MQVRLSGKDKFVDGRCRGIPFCVSNPVTTEAAARPLISLARCVGRRVGTSFKKPSQQATMVETDRHDWPLFAMDSTGRFF